jgi:hypothetical protein
MSSLRASRGVRLGEDLVYKVERGARIPRPEFFDKADQVIGVGGKIAAMKADAAEVGAYGNHNRHGLLQTEEYARALFEMRWPA